MRAICVLGLLLVGGCDRVFGLRMVDDEAPVDARRCEHGTPFAPGTPVPIDGTYSVEAARFTPSRETAYLSLCPPTGTTTDDCDLYKSTFDPVAQVFINHDKLGGVSAPGVYDSYPTVTPDGSQIIFSSRRSGTIQVWTASRSNGSFETPTLTPLDVFPGTDATNEPYLLADGHTLYFSGNTGTTRDLFRAVGDAPTFGSAATPVPGTEDPASDAAPVVSDDELELFFCSNRANGGTGQCDLFTTTRATVDDPFSPPIHLPELSSATGNDWPVWLSPDGCDLYYINKPAGVATLYVTSR